MSTAETESPEEKPRWPWLDDYLHPVERGWPGWLLEWFYRGRDIVAWTIGLTLVPLVCVMLAAAAPALIAAFNAGLISMEEPSQPTDAPQDDSTSILDPDMEGEPVGAPGLVPSQDPAGRYSGAISLRLSDVRR